VVEQQELRQLGCKACEHHHITMGRVFCTNERVTNHKKVPHIGTKCKFFTLKG
jgi:hypothetical protein